MSNFLGKLRAMGAKNAGRLLARRLHKKVMHLVYRPLWYTFRLRNIGHTNPRQDSTPGSGKATRYKESSIRTVLGRIPNGSFLEIGIGEFPHFDRLRIMNDNAISYTGCDFASVCKSHHAELAIKDFDTTRINFAMNSTGTYTWTLFEMLREGKQFDVIYVDGHHTFYIDLPAILLADKLLKPGGYLLLDDIPWNLAFLRSRMMQSIGQWFFYRKMYDFSQYTAQQQSLRHIEMIANELLIQRSGYTLDAELSLPNWWALKKH